MSDAIILFQAPSSNEWVHTRTLKVKPKAATYETINLGGHEIHLTHVVSGHVLFVTDGETKVIVAPCGGNSPEATTPKTLYGIDVVSKYDVQGPEGNTYRIIHHPHKEARW